VKCGKCGRALSPELDELAVLCPSCGFYNCTKCGYFWKPRTEQPKRCPRCTTWLIPKDWGLTQKTRRR